MLCGNQRMGAVPLRNSCAQLFDGNSSQYSGISCPKDHNRIFRIEIHWHYHGINPSGVLHWTPSSRNRLRSTRGKFHSAIGLDFCCLHVYAIIDVRAQDDLPQEVEGR